MIFNEVYEMMKNPNQDSLNKSLNDVHLKGVFSLVVGGTENGLLTRVFIATKKIKPFDIQFHSHRYNLTIGVIHGNFKHHIALEDFGSDYHKGKNVRMNSYEYKSPLNGGNGLTKTGGSCYELQSYDVPVGGEIFLPNDLIHSVSVSKGSMWIVQEHGFVDDSSTVLGTSFITEGLYNEPKQYQVNDMYQLVFEKLKKLVDTE